MSRRRFGSVIVLGATVALATAARAQEAVPADEGALATDVQVERRGTDKPDWGDDSYSMPAILHGFMNNVANLDELARLHARLLREYPNQVDAIERFYDQERIRIMERKR